jgi:hypothetical protein
MARRQFPDRDKGSATLGSARTRISQQGLAAASVGLVAFICYYATLLPGLDLGDSASFQTGIGSLTLTPRQAYPLYYGLSSVVAWLHPAEAARAANLASAIYGAMAVVFAAWLAARLTESTVAGIAAGLFLAFAYTFWTQAITAEVYTLHLMIVAAATLSLVAWGERPTTTRLALFYSLYALGFGNHLSMILLLPAFTAFLLMHRRRAGVSDPLQPHLIGLAMVIAGCGALQYAWNFRGLWAELEPPGSMTEAFGKLWFDVTKADWRDTLVMSLSESGLRNRPAMYWFDVRQQLGTPGVALAAVGLGYLLLRWPRRGVLLLLMYLSNLAFAWTYNVGDAYIFFLPSHFVLALCAGAGIAAIVAAASRLTNPLIATTAGFLCVLYPIWRGYDNYPAVDRSWDNRAAELLDGFTAPPPPTSSTEGFAPAAIYGVDTNWQVQNAFEYYMRERKPGVGWFVTEQLEWLQGNDVTAAVRSFVDANNDAGRAVVVSQRVVSTLESLGYEGGVAAAGHSGMGDRDGADFLRQVQAVRAGTPYVLAVLLPDREYPLDRTAVEAACGWLTARRMRTPQLRHFTAIVGRVGQAAIVVDSRDRPFRSRVRVDEFQFDIRMESWLPTDTIRRSGFGHVIVNGRHFLTLERGISFAAVEPATPVYHSGLFAPIPRFTLLPSR